MLDRVLRRLLDGVVLGLIAATAAASVATGYTSFTLLVRVPTSAQPAGCSPPAC